MIQSVDRLDLAEKPDKRLKATGKTMDILVQLKEASKFGIAPDSFYWNAENPYILFKTFSNVFRLREVKESFRFFRPSIFPNSESSVLPLGTRQ